MAVFYLFTNSPGEVYGWTLPMAQRISSDDPTAIIDIFLTPCQYSMGREQVVCQGFPNVRHVFTPTQTLNQLYIKQPIYESGTVIALGGNPMYAIRFAKQSNSKLIGYTEHELDATPFDRLFLKSDGYDLMASGITPIPEDERHGIVLLPGSRPEHLSVALPFMLNVMSECNTDLPIQVMLSPFVSDDQLLTIQQQYPKESIQRLQSVNDLAGFKFALTIPGTNTMQLGLLGIPFLMILPTHRSKVLRLEGLIGLLLMLPLIGPLLKWVCLRIIEKRNVHYALPNLVLNKSCCPEMVGQFSPKEAAITFSELINDSKQYHEIVSSFKKLWPNKNVLDDVIDELKC